MKSHSGRSLGSLVTAITDALRSLSIMNVLANLWSSGSSFFLCTSLTRTKSHLMAEIHAFFGKPYVALNVLFIVSLLLFVVHFFNVVFVVVAVAVVIPSTPGDLKLVDSGG